MSSYGKTEWRKNDFSKRDELVLIEIYFSVPPEYEGLSN